MKKIITLSLIVLCISLNAYSVNYVSNVANGSWNTNTSWTPVGIPGVNDNVTIQNGQTITMTVANSCINLTVSGILKFNANVTLSVTGNYTLNASGTEQGTGTISFNTGTGTFINVLGTTGSTFRYFFNSSRTINAGSVINKLTSNTQIAAGKTVINLGSYTMGNMLNATTSQWTNGANSKLFLSVNGFMAAGVFVATAAGNSVTLNYVTGSVPVTQGATGYSKLKISGVSGTKSLAENTIVGDSLLISAGNTLDMNGNDLSVQGNWVNNGIFTASTGNTVTFNGTLAQTIASVGTTTFEKLTINNTAGVSITSGTYILNQVLTNNNGTFNTNGNSFTLISNAIKTARIAPLTGTGSFSGNFIVQRFINTRDTTYADLSSPVAASTFADWNSELPFLSFVNNPPFQYPTQYTYSETSDDYVPLTNPAAALTPGKGFEVFLAGSYSYANFPNTTLTTIGVPNSGNQNLSALISHTHNPGSNLVGNPFASSILWNTVYGNSSNIDINFDMFDYTTGGYATHTLGDEIGSSQGFWVYTIGASPTLNIPESAKTTSSNSSLRAASIQPYFTLKLSSTDINNTFSHTLKVAATPDATDGFDFSKDHPFRKSPLKTAPSIYTTIDGTNSVIDVFNSSDISYSMPVSVAVGVSGYYKIEANGFDYLSDYACVQLEDKLLNKLIDLKTNTTYSFRLNTTDDANRFVVHFGKEGSCKSLISTNSATSAFANQVEVLPTTQGNVINFNYGETTNATVSITNLLGQSIVDAIEIPAFNQSLNISLPEGFKGMYLVKVESANGTVVKKFVK